MAEAKKVEKYFDYTGAIKLMGKASKLEPENTTVLMERGNMYLLMERLKNAKKDFEAVIAIDSTHASAWMGMSDYFRLSNELDTAMKCAELAQILAADGMEVAKAKITLAEVYMAQEMDSIAAVHFMTSLELDSTNVNALKKISYLLADQGRYDEANSYLMQAYFYDRFDIEILVNLAYTFNKVEFYIEAIEYANYALDLDPQHPLILSNRAYSYLHSGQEALALEDIKRSITNDDRNPMAYRYEGEIYLAMQETDKACQSFKKAEKYGYADAYDDGIVALQLQVHCKED